MGDKAIVEHVGLVADKPRTWIVWQGCPDEDGVAEPPIIVTRYNGGIDLRGRDRERSIYLADETVPALAKLLKELIRE